MNVVSRNYFMVRGGHSVYSMIHWFCSTIHSFLSGFDLSILAYVSRLTFHLVNVSFEHSRSGSSSSGITQ